MKIIADLHIHSKYSRAVSKDMTLENLDAWADDKGVTLLGTGDFTHPLWMKEIENKLEPAEDGLLRLKNIFKKKTIKGTVPDTRFMLSAEISSIYSRGGKMRRVHNLIFAPSIISAKKINERLSRIGNLASDGRPILGIDSEKLLKLILDVDASAVMVPAHIWTPWFSVFGSMSGFDSLSECFGDMSKYIFAIETGLSSDPVMNRMVSALDKITLISNSDSHSLERIGREANILECELSYRGVMDSIKNGFIKTIEFFPEEGKYHYDGHRLCGLRWSPSQTKKNKGICSGCGSLVTVGVLSRIGELADRSISEAKKLAKPFERLVSLDSIIGEALDRGVKTKTVRSAYNKLISIFGSEMDILIKSSISEISSVSSDKIAKNILSVRRGELKITPGYDGEYGIIKIT